MRRLRCVRATSAAFLTVLFVGGSARAQVPAAIAPAVDNAESTSAAAGKADAAQPEAAPQPTVESMLANTRFRIYTDVGFGRPLQEKLPAGGLEDSHYSFQIADLHLFLTSKLSDDWSVLGEALVTSDFTNEPGIEMDRLLVQYNPNRYLRVAFGKFNSGIGYYPNQFHRAKFYQTATGRPMMFSDEDNGGVLPVHQIGVSAQGQIPSGKLGLRYIAEVGNGRSVNMNSNEVQTFADENDAKAVNAGLSVRPDDLPALDVGFTVYRDRIQATATERTTETITAAHAVWLTPELEFLNEAVVLRHTADGSSVTATTKGFYTQLSRRFDRTRPYIRYEYQDVPIDDPVFGLGDVIPISGVRKALSLGVRFDLSQLVVFKVQYDHALQFGNWANGAHAQLAVAF